MYNKNSQIKVCVNFYEFYKLIYIFLYPINISIDVDYIGICIDAENVGD